MNNEDFADYYISLLKKIKAIPNEDHRDMIMMFMKQTKNLYYESRIRSQVYMDNADDKVLRIFEDTEMVINVLLKKYGK